jgi:hypothetical protein
VPNLSGVSVPWANITGIQLASLTSPGAVPALNPVASSSGSQTQVWLRGDDSWQPLPTASPTVSGIVPISPWATFSPTITPGSGAFAGTTVTGSYMQMGKTVFVSINSTITSVGSASGTLSLTLPVPPKRTTVLSGRETAVSGLAITLTTVGNATIGTVVTAGNAIPTFAANCNYSFSGVYEAA